VAALQRRLTRLARRVLPALAIFVLLAGALALASDAAAGSARFGRFYGAFLGASALALLVLVVVIIQRIARLLAELKRQTPGARLTRRMLLMLIALAVPPVLVVYGFALFFLNATIDNWFNVHLEQALGDALEIGRAYLDERLESAEQKSSTFASELAVLPDSDLQARVDAALDAQGVTQLTVFGDNGTVLATASSDPRFLNPAYPDAAALLQVQNAGRYAAAEPVGSEERLTLRVVLPLPGSGPGPRRLLQALYPVPDTIRPLTTEVEKASFDFQRLKFLRDSLKLTFALVLTFVLLLSALFAVLTAFGVARRLTAPIGRLATATRAVGEGRYDTPLPIAGDDELGFLLT
jgi:nitrogen fixation/metabolism regulation signal transduction histidine kinase